MQEKALRDVPEADLKAYNALLDRQAVKMEKILAELEAWRGIKGKNVKRHIYIYIIGGLGELVRLVRPPVTGRSASFRLRFRFVRAVRAVRGEAKLRGRT